MAINGQTVLAVIPARSGSKRCPGKNFKDFRGKPLYHWSIDAAKGSKYIDTVKLCLDKDRPPELCTDQAMNEDVLRYCLSLEPHDWVVLLQPTSPLRTSEDIDKCIEFAQRGDACVTYRANNTKNGAVYVAKHVWIGVNNFDFPHLRHYMPDERSLDIDFPEQFE